MIDSVLFPCKEATVKPCGTIRRLILYIALTYSVSNNDWAYRQMVLWAEFIGKYEVQSIFA